MSAIHDIDEARRIARQLEDREASRVGRLDLAREQVARRVGISPGTLENLRRGKLKTIGGWARDRLKAALAKELRDEITRLEHQLELVRIGRRDVTADQMATAEALLREARELIGQ